jgi:CheY-like chemotaxis protein
VWAASEGPGKGSEFTVRLPLARAPPSVPEPGAAPAPDQIPRQRILVVDDSEDTAESMQLLLQLDGHDVRTAHDGPQAIAAAADFRPDVILLDIGLPGLDGYAVTRILRGNPELAGCRIIAVSGYAQDSDRQRSYQAGCDAHMVKPIEISALQSVLAEGREQVGH